MKKVLAIAILATMGMGIAHAEYLWYAPQAQLESNIDCWNSGTCEPEEVYGYLTNIGTGDHYTATGQYLGLAGTPLVYGFKIAEDAALSGGWYFDSLAVRYTGPGFDYRLSHAVPSATVFYVPGPPSPGLTMTVPEEGSGCVEVEIPLEWTWENFPDGEVALTEDFVVEAGETLVVDPGMLVFASGAYGITVNGMIEVNGTRDAWVTFDGLAWQGIDMTETGDGNICFARITGVEGNSAVTVSNHLIMTNCLIDHNMTTGNGGGVMVDAGSAILHSCTVAHNTADGEGNNVYLATGAAMGGYYSLFAFGSFVSVDDEISTLQYSAFYPLDGLDPEAVGYSCDPGFVDADNGDYNISFWDVENPDEINCVIDVSIIPTDDDPDGTPKDIGAFPFDQHAILLPAQIDAVYDVPMDQGGRVYIDIMASPNDGSHINPVAFYGVWRMDGETPVSVDVVPALGEAMYVTEVATLSDSVDVDNPGITTFKISTHYSNMVAMSDPVDGWSVDNIAPMPVTGTFASEEFTYSPTWEELWGTGENPELLITDLSWDASSANDFDHFRVLARLNGTGEASEVYIGTGTSATHQVNWDELDCDTGDHFVYEIVAVDAHRNVSEFVYEDGPTCVGVSEALPTEFSLEQNYPNPFNPTTTIAYSLPVAGNVSLKVYNVLGAEVVSLVNEQQPAGRYEVVLDASALASGMYFYRLTSGEFTSLRKMVLVK